MNFSGLWPRVTRYSLGRLILIISALFGIALAYLWCQAQNVASIVHGVELLGGTLRFSYEVDAKGIDVIDPRPAAPDWIRALVGDNYFVSPYSVDLSSKRFT